MAAKKSAMKRWEKEVEKKMPHLTKPQAIVLAMWSFGIVVTKVCGLDTVSFFLARLLGRKHNTVRCRLREWYEDAKDKKGDQRSEIDVTSCFGPLVKWILSLWAKDEKRLVFVLDATTLGSRFVVLAISIVCNGCAIPVAWKVLTASQKGAWKPHWIELLARLQGCVPCDWFVVVMADRGLYARWLFKAIVKNQWHPFLRINAGGQYRIKGRKKFRALSGLITKVGRTWQGEVICFKNLPLECTLLARWDEAHEEPWLIVTDLKPEQADATWYAMRAWIECGFKDLKRGGWQWQNTRMTDPKRAERLWLAMAVATLWTVAVGSEDEITGQVSSFEHPPDISTSETSSPKPKNKRLLSCLRKGMLIILAMAINGRAVPLGQLHPQPWPSVAEILKQEDG